MCNALQSQDLALFLLKLIEADAATHFVYLLLLSAKYRNVDKYHENKILFTILEKGIQELSYLQIKSAVSTDEKSVVHLQ